MSFTQRGKSSLSSTHRGESYFAFTNIKAFSFTYRGKLSLSFTNIEIGYLCLSLIAPSHLYPSLIEVSHFNQSRKGANKT